METLKQGAVKVLGNFEARTLLVCAAGLCIFGIYRLAAFTLVLAIAKICEVLFQK